MLGLPFLAQEGSMSVRRLVCAAWVVAVMLATGPSSTLRAGGARALEPQSASPRAQSDASGERALLNQYCVTCHNTRTKAGELVLESLDPARAVEHPELWEKVIRKLRTRAMPPPGSRRPDERGYQQIVSYLETVLDARAATAANPGRTDTFRRLTRTEYQNAVRDLLAVDVDVTELLPKDDASYGFDNVSAVGLSPTLVERYLSAAQKVTRLAVGTPATAPAVRVVTLPPDLTQEEHVDGLPFGTRGGTIVLHTFPRDGEYEIQVRLMRNRNENVEGLTEPNQLEVTLDGQRLQLFTVVPNRNRMGDYYADESVDKHLQLRTRVTAGPHAVGAAFLRKNGALIETERQPYDAHFNMNRHPRLQPAVYTVSITGPLEESGGSASADARQGSETPSRERIFVCRPASAALEEDCAKRIVSTVARRAYRRPVTDREIAVPLQLYTQARAESGFEGGIEVALRAILTSPEFLFRIERDPAGAASGAAYRISDVELASRLSFFLWSSIPDDRLLDLATSGRLRERTVLDAEVRRMLADPRAEALTTNFASQWLYLRNLAAAVPNLRLYPDFDDNLRQGFRRETELFFQSIVQEDRPVIDLLDADYTFLNERLARHYDVPHVYGDRFRRVTLPAGNERRGLLGHGSILTVTSHATRTSPVRRGKWILENILGTPPPAPPADVPPLKENRPGAGAQTMRELMEEHRSNAVCAACHRSIDPLGLALENFDAVGRWRTRGEDGAAVDASGSMPGGEPFDGVAGLRQALLARPDVFVGTLTEKLLTYGLGRGIDVSDAPAVRAIRRDAAADDYRFSALIGAIVRSAPFQMRRAADRPSGGTAAGAP
jgi:mono/diheme cytochrome c family protein